MRLVEITKKDALEEMNAQNLKTIEELKMYYYYVKNEKLRVINF